MKKIIEIIKFVNIEKRNIESDKGRDHCHLTGDYRGPSHSICNINITQKQSNFLPIVFHIFSNYDCHLFSKKLIDKKNDKVKFDILPKTNEEYISVTFRCIRFIDSYRFLSSSLDSLVKTLVKSSNKTLKDFEEEIVDNDEILNIVNEIKLLSEEDRNNNDSIEDLKKDYPDNFEKLKEALLIYMGGNNLKILKTENPEKWKLLTKKLAYRYECFNNRADYKKPVDSYSLEKENFFSD